MPDEILDPIYRAVTAEGVRQFKSNEDVYAVILALIEVVNNIPSGGGTLTDGSGITASGTSPDLGGTLDKAAVIQGNGNTFQIADTAATLIAGGPDGNQLVLAPSVAILQNLGHGNTIALTPAGIALDDSNTGSVLDITPSGIRIFEGVYGHDITMLSAGLQLNDGANGSYIHMLSTVLQINDGANGHSISMGPAAFTIDNGIADGSITMSPTVTQLAGIGGSGFSMFATGLRIVDGVNGSEINLDNNKLELRSTTNGIELNNPTIAQGAYYAANYSINGVAAHGDRWITDKGYTDNTIGSKTVAAIVKAPTVAEDGFALVWNNASNTYDLADVSSGGGTEIIFEADCTGQASSTTGIFAKASDNSATGNPSGKSITQPSDVGIINGSMMGFQVPKGGLSITKFGLKIAQAAVSTSVVGATPSVRIRFFRNEYNSRTQIGADVDVVLDPTGVNIFGSLNQSAFQYQSININIPVNEGDNIGWEFVPQVANQNGIVSIARYIGTATLTD